ncbi:MAG: DUF1501 domain-containing protein, partial [Bacteroidota bacterium]
PPAIVIGNTSHATCEGSTVNYSFAVADPDRLTTLPPGGDTGLTDDNYGEEVEFLRASIEQTNVYGEQILTASATGENAVVYPRSGGLSQKLRHVARLISGGLRTKVYTVSIGGFDTHASQTNQKPDEGTHAELLQSVSEAITAFQQDLVAQGLSERVIGLTYSEFGRRIRSNNSMGTDHGDAAPMFLFGDCVGGNLVGSNPQIDPDVSQRDGVAMQYDFRDVYASILIDWFQATESEVRSIFYEDFQHLPILIGCQPSLPVELIEFTAEARDKYIELTWRTSLEDNNAGYTVERSLDGRRFTQIGWVPAAPSSSTGERAYGFADRDVRDNVLYYYRLRQEDRDGSYEFSQVRSAKLLKGAANEWQVGALTPNPATQRTAINVTAPESGNIGVTVYDTAARMVFTEAYSFFSASERQIEINLGRIPRGAYAVHVNTPDGRRHHRKLLIQ